MPYFKIVCIHLSWGLHKSIQGSDLLFYCPTTSRTIRLCADHKYPLQVEVPEKVKRRLQRFSYHDNKDISVFQGLETLLFPCMQFTCYSQSRGTQFVSSLKEKKHGHIIFSSSYHSTFSFPISKKIPNSDHVLCRHFLRTFLPLPQFSKSSFHLHKVVLKD